MDQAAIQEVLLYLFLHRVSNHVVGTADDASHLWLKLTYIVLGHPEVYMYVCFTATEERCHQQSQARTYYHLPV